MPCAENPVKSVKRSKMKRKILMAFKRSWRKCKCGCFLILIHLMQGQWKLFRGQWKLGDFFSFWWVATLICHPTVNHLSPDCSSFVGQVLVVCRLTVNWQSTERFIKELFFSFAKYLPKASDVYISRFSLMYMFVIGILILQNFTYNIHYKVLPLYYCHWYTVQACNALLT